MNTYCRKLRLLCFFACFMLVAAHGLCQEYGYDVAIKNFRQTDETTFEWDIYLRAAPHTEEFALYMMQVRLAFNNDILNSGDFLCDDFTITGIGAETKHHAAFFSDNDCTVTGVIPNRQLNWAITNPPGNGEKMTIISDAWIRIAGFRASLSNDGHPHHFASTNPEFAFHDSGNQVIVRRANNTSSTYDGNGSTEVPRNSSTPASGVPVESRQLAAYHFSGNGNWSDNHNWNSKTHKHAFTTPAQTTENIIISGHAILNEPTTINQLSVISTQTVLPTVSTGEFDVPGWNSTKLFAVTKNNISDEGDMPVTDRGAIVGKDENPTMNNHSDIFSTTDLSDSFFVFRTNSGHNVEDGDYFRAYATSEAGTAYGQAFRVPDLEPGAGPVGGLTEVPGGLTIEPAGRLTATSIYNDAGVSGILVRSSPAGTASLIHDNDDLEATVEQYIPASEGWAQKSPAPDHWYWISPPTGEQSVDAFLSALDEGSGYDLYRWDEQADQWINHKGQHFGHERFEPGQGYLFAPQTDATYSYSGVLFSGNHTWDGLSRGHTDAEHGPGWHLIGNPYTSGLAYNDEHWSSSSVSYTPQYWVEADGSYSAYLEGQVIPPSTAFFVEALTDNASLTIGKAARTHHDPAQKTTKSRPKGNSDYMILSAHPVEDAAPGNQESVPDAEGMAALPLKGSSRQRAYIRLVPEQGEGMSHGFDNRYHSRFRPGDAPVFYAAVNGEKLLVHAIGANSAHGHIPYCFQKNNDSNTFRIKLEKNTANIPLLLHDLQQNIKHHLKAGKPYTFTSCSSDDVSRFELIIGGRQEQEMIPEETTVADVWVHDNTLNLNCYMENTKLRLFDMNGRLVLEYHVDIGTHVYDLTLPAGIYLLHLNKAHHVHSEHIIVH